MGVFDKLKNVFFEEEYVEVEEPVKKPKREKPAIAKKIDLPDMPKIKEEKSAREKEIEEEVVERAEKKGINERSLKRSDRSFKFPMTFEDEDFTIDTYVNNENNPVKPVYSEVKSDKIDKIDNGLYSGYDGHKEKEVGSRPYESSDYKKEQKVFRPTPIISPIYGILDKNYKKDEIVQKKEVRLSSISSKKVDLDSVREKAYGDLASDITASIMGDNNDKENLDEVSNLANDLYDLNDTEQPVVTSVTVGDAEEYFNDLGLEYNVDYKDEKKDKATGRRSNKTSEKDFSEDSLFDLIDSMYDKDGE